MAKELNANILTQLANDQIEVNEVANILDGMYNEIFREIADIEAQLAPKKAKLRGINEALAAMMPKSKAIHYTPVLQVV